MVELPSNKEVNVGDYKLSKEQLHLFGELKKEFAQDKEITDLRILMAVTAKKTREKSQKCLKKFGDLIRKIEYDKITHREVKQLLPIMTYLKGRGGKEKQCGIVTFTMRRFTKGSLDGNELMRGMIYFLETIMAENVDNVKYGLVMLCDLKGAGWGNFDLQLEKLVQSILNSIPIRMRQMIIVTPPFIVKFFMKLLLPFVGQKLRDRMVTVQDISSLSTYMNLKDVPKSIDAGNGCDFDQESYEKWMLHGFLHSKVVHHIADEEAMDEMD